jgi:Flp pilus assembly protein CpaB
MMFQNKKYIQILLAAVMTVIIVQYTVKQKEQSLENAYGMVEVLAAARDIPPHKLLTPEYITTIKVPQRFIQPGAIQVKIPSQALARVQGKVTLAPLPEGSQITLSNLVEPSIKDTGVAPLLPPGKRGYLLRLGNLDVAQLILPGDHIDIMATFTVRQKESNSKATYTILQNILVVGVGKELKKQKDDVTGKKGDVEGLVLTLALEPVEAERLALSQSESQGEISVIVRPHGENDVHPVPGVNPGYLLGAPATPPAAVPGR